MSIYAQITQEYHISAEREKRAQEIVQQRALQFKGLGIDSVDAVVNVHHITAIQRVASGLLDVSCTCPDWRTRGKAQRSPCKHILALAKEIDTHGLMQGVTPVVAPATTTPVQHRRPSPPPPAMPVPSVPASFADQVQQTIASVIERLADRIEDVLHCGGIPFLVGPTGCGKTSAVRLVAIRNGWGFEEVAGSHSFADADLVGLRTDHQELPGIFARAFKRARNEETVLLFLDELLRAPSSGRK